MLFFKSSAQFLKEKGYSTVFFKKFQSAINLPKKSLKT